MPARTEDGAEFPAEDLRLLFHDPEGSSAETGTYDDDGEPALDDTATTERLGRARADAAAASSLAEPAPAGANTGAA